MIALPVLAVDRGRRRARDPTCQRRRVARPAAWAPARGAGRVRRRRHRWSSGLDPDARRAGQRRGRRPRADRRDDVRRVLGGATSPASTRRRARSTSGPTTAGVRVEATEVDLRDPLPPGPLRLDGRARCRDADDEVVVNQALARPGLSRLGDTARARRPTTRPRPDGRRRRPSRTSVRGYPARRGPLGALGLRRPTRRRRRLAGRRRPGLLGDGPRAQPRSARPCSRAP